MKIKFSKYHGAGNDFIMIDGRTLERSIHEQEVVFLCHRHFGIGADGVIVVMPSHAHDFEMKYYNSDGSYGAMCSNGSRCAIEFSRSIGYVFDTATFSCCEKVYQGKIRANGTITTSFPDAVAGTLIDEGYLVDTGAPHYILFLKNFVGLNPQEAGRRIRYDEKFSPAGTNVNFIHVVDENYLEIITYERGVEDLTLACGTGALAAAIAHMQKSKSFGKRIITVESDGGELAIELSRSGDAFLELNVIGPARHVFSAEITVQKLATS